MRARTCVRGLIVAFTVSMICLPQWAMAQKPLTGAITVDTTLDTVGGVIYHVTANVSVDPGVTLTILPSVVLKFDIGRTLTVNGNITAVGGGTPATRIYFTSIRDDNLPTPSGDDTNGDGNTTVPNNRDWGGIIFQDSASDASVLQNCDVIFGGSTSSLAVITCNDASPNLIGSNISAGHYGIRCNGVSDPLLRNTSINAMIDVPVAIEIASNPEFDNVVFASSADNGFDAIGLLGSTLNGANRLSIRGATLDIDPIDNFVYILLGDVIIAPAAVLTIQPGVVMKPKNGVDITVNGTLVMDGTADPDSQIVVTSFKDDNYGVPSDTNNDGSSTSPVPSDWGLIEFLDGSTGSVTNANLRFGGETTEGVLRAVNSSPTIADVVISDVAFGIEQKGLSASTIDDCSISNTTNTPFYLSVSASPTFAGNTFTNVGIAAIGIIGETIAVDSTIPVRNVAGFTNITYWLYTHLTMAFGSTLTIEPAVVMKFRKPNAHPRIIIEGALVADGTPVAPITFTSQYDDDVGNPADTEGNGSATVPDDGQWGFIKLSETSNDLTTILDNCHFLYGGQDLSFAYRGVVWCNSSAPTITNCEFRSNETGIRTDGNAAPLIQGNGFFNNEEVPLATSVVADPIYLDNGFDQNQYHAVGILAETLAQNATLEKILVGGPPEFPEYFPYLHLGTLTVGNGVTLTYEPDIVVKVLAGGVAMEVNGGLVMQGTAADRIVYTSIKDDSYGGDSNVDGSATSPASANWQKIVFNPTTIDGVSLLEHCLFRFGGTSSRGVVELQSASPTIRNCEFELDFYGLWIQNASDPTVQNNLFRLIDRAPISKSILAQPTFSGNLYDNNAYDVLGLIGEDIAQDLTLATWNVAGYTNITRALVGGNLDVNFGSTLTVQPGVVLKMGPVNVGTFRSKIVVGGALVADGTLADPIVFTSIRDDNWGNPSDSNTDGALTLPSRFDWQEMHFQDISEDAANLLDHCVVHYGGNPGHVVRIESASPTISNSDFQTNYNYGIRIQGDSQPVIQDCTFGGHDITPILMSLVSAPVFSGNVFEPTNTYSALGILGETLASDVTWPRRTVAKVENIPYILTGNLTAGLSSILTIEPGVVIKPLSGVDIIVKRGIIAEGLAQPDRLIVFTSPRDDFYGGDTNNDGAATDGSSLRWGQIEIANEAIDASTRFSNCVFRYSTNSTTIGALNITNANPQVSDCIFSRNGIGLNYIGAAGDPTKGSVQNCDIFDNTNYGIKNTGQSFTVDARFNWWGDDTGPYDPSDDTATGGFFNPGGLGDEVTDKVDYGSWTTGGVQNVFLGDVSLNGEVRAYDASLVLQDIAALITLTPLQDLVGDVNCSGGSPSTLDASLILRLVAGLDSYFPCAYVLLPKQPVMLTEKYPGSEPGEFEVGLAEAVLTPSESAVIAVDVRGEGELLGHEYRLGFDPDLARIEDVRLTQAAATATLFWSTDERGQLFIALASAELLPVSAAVEIVVIAGDALEAELPDPLTLTYARLNEQEIVTPTSAPSRPAFWLGQNRPNPFNPATVIEYSVSGDAGSMVPVKLEIFDLRGRRVSVLVDSPQLPGPHEVTWTGRDETGRRVASGVYFYRIVARNDSSFRKMVLLQ